jgi:hypothetical protein
MLEEMIVWYENEFTGAWEPLESFTREEMNGLEREEVN